LVLLQMMPLTVIPLFLQCVFAVRYSRLSSSTGDGSATCVGSNQPCEGNSCCPGFTGSLGRTFPCPTAEDSVHDCDVDVRYDLYNASLMDFTHVAVDQLSAETDGTGEAVITEIGWWMGQRLDLYIQSVNEFGERTPLPENAFKALKPQENGRLLRFDFLAEASGTFRFFFGSWEDGIWTSLVMPWTTITLMDIDCGRRSNCETVTSADHVKYDAGDQVRVSVEGNSTVFRDMLVSGAGNNPTSVVLTEEQQSIAVALYFENTAEFTLHMANGAKWPRTFLVAGISSVQWPSIYTPAPTPFPTPPPTEARTHPPTTTPVPTPSPTCPFSSVSGNCEVDCMCIGSPNYPENYPADASCVIEVASGAALEVKDFSTEVFWDTLSVDDKIFYGTAGPDRVVAEREITFSSDGTDQDLGWHICALLPATVPTPAPTPYPTSSMELEGPCEFFGEGDICVQSPNYPLDYDDYEHCTIRFTESTTLYVGDFFTEKFSDKLTVDGVSYTGKTCPEQFNVTATSEIEWSSDWGTVHRGWRVCTQAVPPPPVPAPSGPIDPLFRQLGVSASSPMGTMRSAALVAAGVMLGLIMLWACMKCFFGGSVDGGEESSDG